MMFRFLVIGVGSVLVILAIARKSLQARVDIPKKIRLRHYAFVLYLVFMNAGGLSQTHWTFRRLLDGNLIGPLEQKFIVIRELPAFIGSAIWVFGAVGQSITVLLAFKVARLNGECRAVLIRLFPLLVAAEGAASLISIRGADGVAFIQPWMKGPFCSVGGFHLLARSGKKDKKTGGRKILRSQLILIFLSSIFLSYSLLIIRDCFGPLVYGTITA